MPISITGQLKVSTLQSRFLKEFGLTLRIYDGRSFADPDQTLAQVRKKKGSGNELSVAKNMKVGNLEDKFEAEFGLKVQVAGSDDSYLCDNDLTLNQAQLEDEKKLQRKDRKSAKNASKADDVDQSKGDSDADAVQVCLTFGTITTTYFENTDGDWVEAEELEDFHFAGTEDLDSDALTKWCSENLQIEFDGDLDEPDAFSSIKALKMSGPDAAEYGASGLTIEGLSIYLSVTSPDDLSDENLEDLFHLVVPVIETDEGKMGFTDFEEYEATFEDAPSDGKALSVSWDKD